MAQQTAMQQLIKWMIEKSRVIPFDQEDCYDKAIELLQIEKEQLFDAMMYALDEDGHTGDWKVKFINDYIDKL